MPRVYLAAPFVLKADAYDVKLALEEAGFDVTSNWITNHGDTTDPEILAEEAWQDLEDLAAADGMVVLQYAQSEGKSVEQGAFLMGGVIGRQVLNVPYNKIVVVSPDGHRGNIFQYLTKYFTVVPTIQAAIQEVRKWKTE